MFYLRDPKSDKETNIFFMKHFAKEKKNFKYGLGLKILPSDWDAVKKAPRQKRGNAITPMHRAITKRLINFKATTDEILAEYKGNNIVPTIAEFKEQLDSRVRGSDKNKKKTFFEAMQELIDEKIKEKKAWNTIRSEKKAVNILRDYEKAMNKTLTFESIDKNFYSDFLYYCREIRDVYDNTTSREIVRLRSFMDWSLEKGYHNNKAHKKFKRIEYDADNIALSEDHLKRLEELKAGDNVTGEGGSVLYTFNKKYDKVRDLFLIGCYSGQRISDYSVFDEADIQNEMIVKRAKKTGKKSYIPLHSKLRRILEKYDYNLPKISAVNFNKYIKHICHIAGFTEQVKKTKRKGAEKTVLVLELWKMVSSHTARRSFITIALRKGMQQKIVMQITGIAKRETLDRYNKIEEDDVKNAMDELWN